MEALRNGSRTRASSKYDKNLLCQPLKSLHWCVFHHPILTCFPSAIASELFTFAMHHRQCMLHYILQYIKYGMPIKNNLVFCKLDIIVVCSIVNDTFLLYSFHASNVRFFLAFILISEIEHYSELSVCVSMCTRAHCNINPIKSKLILIKSERMAFFIRIYR